MKLLAGILACSFAPGLPSPPARVGEADVRVAVERRDGESMCSINAGNASLGRVLDHLATQLGVVIEGLEDEDLVQLVTIELEDRPVDQALEYLLGSVGLRHQLRRGVLRISSADTRSLDRMRLLDLASAAYLKAITQHSRHALAPSIRLDQGKVEEMRGHPGAALDHYQTLIEQYPKAESVPEAYMRSGKALQELGRWAESSQQFQILASLDRATGYHAAARLELARSTIELGDPEGAFYQLESLDSNYPLPRSPGEWTARAVVRAKALIGLDRHLEALRLMDAAEPLMTSEERDMSLEVRAMAFAGAGLPGEAGRAWLLYGNAVGGKKREEALEQAARLALESDDELGALFVCRESKRLGLGARFEPIRLEARRRLGFIAPEDASKKSASDRILLAEKHIEEGRLEEAADLVEHLLRARQALEEDLDLRLCVVWSRVLERREGLDRAIAWLREVRASFEGSRDARARIDVAAAELFEGRALVDQAIDAYRGIY